MKVLIVRIGGKISGAEIYNLNLLKAFKRYKDIKITFVTNLVEFSSRILKLNHRCEVIKPWVLEIGTKKDFLKALLYFPIYIFSFLKVLKKLEKDGKFEIICFQSMTEKIFFTLIMRTLFYKVLWIEHGPLFKTDRSIVIKFLYKLLGNFVDKIIAVSKDTKQDLIKGGVNRDRILDIYIGIDTDFFSPLSNKEAMEEKKKMHISKNNFIVGFLGSITKEKGIKDFIDISRNILKKNRHIKFLVIGDGPLYNLAVKKIKEFKIEKNYFFTGFTDNVRNYLGIIDILFFPTKHHEGLSMAIIESLSMGLTIITNDIGGNRELIKNEINGFLYNSSINKNNQIVDKILSLLSNKKLREKIRINSRNYAKRNFNIKKNLKEFYILFKTL